MGSEQPKCPVCNTAADIAPNDPGKDTTRYDCPRCGRFEITESVVLRNLAPVPRAILSHALRRMQERNEWPLLTTRLAEQIIATHRIPTPMEQEDLFLSWLGRSLGGRYGSLMDVSILEAAGIVGAADEESVNFTLLYLGANGFIERGPRKVGVVGEHIGPIEQTKVTMRGWERIGELTRRPTEGMLAFMAMPFGFPELDELFVEHWKQAVAQTGFELRRIDENPRAGLIDDRLRVEIRRSKLLVAELTEDNRGAYWEAGFAEGLGKPVIYLCRKQQFEKQKTHFDTNHHLTVVWDRNDLGKATEELKATIRATLPAEAKLNDK